MFKRFLERRNPKWMLNRALNIAKNKSREDLLNSNRSKKIDSRINKLTLSTALSMEFSKVRAIINRYLPILYMDETCANILQNGIDIVSRRAPSLGQSLSPSFHVNKITSLFLNQVIFILF